MENLSDNDRQRIEQEAQRVIKLWENDDSSIFTRLREMAEYEHKYQREQQAELRNKVIEECIELLKTNLEINPSAATYLLNSLKK